MNATSSLGELTELLAAISATPQQSVGVDSFEHLLTRLRDLLKSGRVDRADAVAELVRLSVEWPPGAVEALEFTTHDFRWPEVREALENYLTSGADFRSRNLATHVLQAFDDDWPEGEIYRTYRRTDL